MSLHFALPWPFSKPTPQPNHVVIRHVVATKAENRIARQRRADVRMQLDMMVEHMTPAERAIAAMRGSIRSDKKGE